MVREDQHILECKCRTCKHSVLPGYTVNFPLTLPSVTSLKETRDDVVSWKLYMVHNVNSSPELQINMF